MRPVLFIVLSMIFASALISCKSGDRGGVEKAASESSERKSESRTPAGEPVEGDWLIYHLSAEPATLNPITATDAYEGRIDTGNIYDTLIKRHNETHERERCLEKPRKVSESSPH